MAVNAINVKLDDNNFNFYGFHMEALPEGCIATTLSLTSPRDACRLALVDSNFRSAAQSDAVWERFLPPDYEEIVSRSVNSTDLLSLQSKKEIYFHLCRPTLIDGGSKIFFLDKCTGKKCFMLSARDLNIIWSDTPLYWRWISLSESRFSEVAELMDVCWLEVRGKIKTYMLSPNTTYSAFLVFTTRSGIYGFEYQTAEGRIAMDEHHETRAIYLDPAGANYRYEMPRRMPRMGFFNRHFNNMMRMEEPSPHVNENAEVPKKRDNVWSEVLLGEFHIKEGQDSELEISLLEIKGGNWKRGLIMEGIEIRPKQNTRE